MQSIKALIIYAAIACNLSGCVGFGVIHPQTMELNPLSLIKTNKNTATTTQSTNPTKKQILATLGQPNSVTSLTPTEEIWHYRNGFDWIGIAPIILIPIPLALPLIPSSTDIYFVGDISTTAKQTSTGWSGGCLCPENEGTMKYGFYLLK